MRLLLLATGVLTLAACQPPVRLATPPPELTECAPAPIPPIPAPYDWPGIEAAAQSVAEAVELARAMTLERDAVQLHTWLAEREAGADCRAKIAGVRAWSEGVE